MRRQPSKLGIIVGSVCTLLMMASFIVGPLISDGPEPVLIGLGIGFAGGLFVEVTKFSSRSSATKTDS